MSQDEILLRLALTVALAIGSQILAGLLRIPTDMHLFRGATRNAAYETLFVVWPESRLEPAAEGRPVTPGRATRSCCPAPNRLRTRPVDPACVRFGREPRSR